MVGIAGLVLLALLFVVGMYGAGRDNEGKAPKVLDHNSDHLPYM